MIVFWGGYFIFFRFGRGARRPTSGPWARRPNEYHAMFYRTGHQKYGTRYVYYTWCIADEHWGVFETACTFVGYIIYPESVCF